MKPVRTIAPGFPAIDLIEAKEYLRVDFDDDDQTLRGMIDAATTYLDGADGILGRCLVSQSWRKAFPCWTTEMVLPFPGASGVVVTYWDADAAEQTLAASGYELIEVEGRSAVRFNGSMSWPAVDGDRAYPVQIEAVYGYGDPSQVPAPIRAAILSMVSELYNKTAATAQAALAGTMFGQMISPYRVPV